MKNNLKTFLLTILIFVLSCSQAQEFLMKKFDLMPWPASIEDLQNTIKIDSSFSISVNNKEGRVFNYATSVMRRLSNRTGIFMDEGFPSFDNSNATVIVRFNNVADLSITTNESYKLYFKKNKIYIESDSDIGAIRALETLLQLVKYNETEFFFDAVSIQDSPRFVWRGLMIDVSRHFHPVDVLKRNLRGMATMKMNVFHWHLTDDQGFRVESKSLPKLHELASDGLYYTQEQIKEVVAYANSLGIRVIPEIDVPGHATAILTAYPELGSADKSYQYSIERNSGIFDPTLDPTNEKTYEFLETLFKEVSALFPDEYFHIGGDENQGKHWDSNPKIQEFKKEKKLKTNHDLQTYFNIRLEKILKNYGKKLMGWDEILTPTTPKTVVIHAWRAKHEGLPKGGALIEAARRGYQAVLSAGFYIDRMQSIEGHYLVEPIGDIQLSKEERDRILGGEVTMWSELVTSLNIDSRIWPRTAAIAERLWSPKNTTDVFLMKKRLKTINNQLEEVGLTHIRNKDLILRNITRYQSTKSIEVLIGICEPLKIYTRNKEGTEYKTFSPFTLFADAANVDAKDAIQFNKSVKNYLETKSKSDLQIIHGYFKMWMSGYEEFQELAVSPVLKTFRTHYQALNEISQSLQYLQQGLKKNLNKNWVKQLEKNIETLKTPMVDTEFVIVESLELLYKSLKI